MVPLRDVIKKIPQDALSTFEETFTPSQYNKLLLSFREKRITTFRINTLKSDKNTILHELFEKRIDIYNKIIFVFSLQ